jgi:hypothetical protein
MNISIQGHRDRQETSLTPQSLSEEVTFQEPGGLPSLPESR